LVCHIVGSVFGPVRFLLPVCRLSWFLYTLNIYAHVSSHFSQQLLMAEIWYLVTSMCIYKCMLNVYKNQQNPQTRSRNLMGPKTLPTIWGTYMKLVTKYQISAINSCWEKCDQKCAYMFNVYKNQMTGIWYLITSFIYVCHIVGSVFGPVRFLLPVCRFCWFLYTFNIHLYMHICSLWPNIRSLPSIVAEKNVTENVHICSMCIKTN
jgi:hypothetical protein